MEGDNNAFVARFGRTVVRGDSFTAVCEVLVENGYEVQRAKEVQRGVLEIPHATRRPASLRSWHADEQAQAEEAQPEPQWVPPAISVPTVVVGIQVRACGSVHSDGVVCLVPVYFETPACGCADRVYEHDGYHEATDPDSGVTHRWSEVLEIRDADFNAYGPADGDDDLAVTA